MEVRLLVAALRRRLLLIFVLGIVGALAGAYVAQSLGGSYRATASLLLDPTAVSAPGQQQFNGDPERFVGGQLSVLTSRATAERAAAEIGISVDEVDEVLTVDRVVGSDVVEVVGTAPSPRLARDVANAVAESYVAQRREQSAAAVASQLETVQAEVARLEQALSAFPPAAQVTPRQQILINQYEAVLERRQVLTSPGVVRDATAVLDPALLPEEPQRVSPLLTGLAGCVLGLLLGMALAILLDGRRPRITSRAHAEEVLGRRVVAAFPARRRPGRHDSDRALEQARILLAIMNTVPVEGRRVIAVCASTDGRGARPVAEALMAALEERGTEARLMDLGRDAVEAPMQLEPAVGSVRPRGTRGGVTVGERPGGHPEARPRKLEGSEAVRALTADVEVAVLVVPPVLGSPVATDALKSATDVVLVVPIMEQSEPELVTMQQLLVAGAARVHPVVLTGRVPGRA